jgi:hypothetical protein
MIEVYRLWVAGWYRSQDYASRSIAVRDMNACLKAGAEWAHLAVVLMPRPEEVAAKG